MIVRGWDSERIRRKGRRCHLEAIDRAHPSGLSLSIFDLQLTIKDAPELGGWGVDLQYDSDQIRYVSGSFQQSDFLLGFVALTKEEEGLVIPGGGVLGSVTSSQAEGVLGTLSFEALEGFSDSRELVIIRVVYRLTEGRSDEITVRSTAVITSESLVPKLSGDFNGDGMVNLSDFFLFADAFGGTDPEFDLTGDGNVNHGDFFVFAHAYGTKGLAKLLAVAEVYLGVPLTAQLAQNYPNPFNSDTVIECRLPQAGEIQLTVHDLAGQLVSTLASGHHPAGSYSLRWDGLDHSGRDLASGVYLYRLEATAMTGDRMVQTRKLLLLR